MNFKSYLAAFRLQDQALPVGLQELLLALSQACIGLSQAVAQGPLIGLLGTAGTDNVQGEIQQKLDIIANDALIAELSGCSALAGIASEEMELPITVGSGSGDYLILFDPLDGSSNIDVNVSIGTIFSILKKPTPNVPLEPNDFLQAGSQQVAAGYVVYGPQTTLVMSLGAGVDLFTLDPLTDQFILIKQGISIPQAAKEFAINMSNLRHWAKPVQRYIEECLAGTTGVRAKDFNMRWIASMVADVHRVLMRGGVFMYPWDQREPNKPGKLRLMYEANPLSFLVEQAGGQAIDGKQRILEIQPTALHQRVSVMLGAAEEIELLRAYHLPLS
ncbi:class 1 fructose-bisphosphatase [Polynucleobacter sp. IMCC30063]|uniref:class 1 fructose-bisphosphatase n=1 Tax=unclassified Polynucleobacter TaxID=2640945 RepID=UPI001F2DCF49|nr:MULTISPECIES: class 1 fructose-bisphosphatase [unclassified Polynucleobacter]MCE7506816.1 class 1 fructose-bisphosphatase [Polynucleobacter sp. IMCC30063]MCE7528107.1 class 1 fructose-bisphosphatase [Polynucleobacter sp. IMCC 30228]MCE7529946.1 class 1 fructose-bisphosphatase [Polynucleobacter sp. IMCC 29146]